MTLNNFFLTHNPGKRSWKSYSPKNFQRYYVEFYLYAFVARANSVQSSLLNYLYKQTTDITDEQIST